MNPEIRRFNSSEAMFIDIASLICDRAIQSVESHGLFSLVLSGGATPQPLYRLLAQYPIPARIPWEETHLFWGDERCAPPDDKNSNFRTANETLIRQIEIPKNNVHPIVVAGLSPEEAAIRYESSLRDFFPGKNFPEFDLVLLGVGADGHTASLFPGSPALNEKNRWVLATQAPTGFPIRDRITLTLPALNNSRWVLFLVSGPGKSETLSNILTPGTPSSPYPASKISPRERPIWFIHEGT